MNWRNSSTPSKLLRKATEAFRHGQFDRCLQYTDSVLNQNPNEPEALYLAGAASTYLQQSEKAVRYLSQLAVLPEASRFGQLHYYRGSAYMEMEQFEIAIPDFTISIEEHSLLAECYLNRGYCYLRLEQFPEASVDFNLAARFYPRSPEILDLLSFTYQQLNEPRKTLRYLKRLLSLEGLETEQYLRLAWAYEETGQQAEALDAYNWALEQDPFQLVGLNNRGHLLLRQKDFSAAKADFDKGLEVDPDFFALYLNRSSLHLEMQELEAAWQDLQRCLELQPDDPFVHRNRAYYYLLNQQTDKAFTELERLFQQDPHLPLLHYYRGRVYHTLGLREQALSAFQRSADLGEREGEEALARYFPD